jgi:hypothetical protein
VTVYGIATVTSIVLDQEYSSALVFDRSQCAYLLFASHQPPLTEGDLRTVLTQYVTMEDSAVHECDRDVKGGGEVTFYGGE